MTEALRGIVVGHGGVAQALVAAAEEISGVRGSLVAVSNSGLGREQLEQTVVEAVGDRPAILFVDLPSGEVVGTDRPQTGPLRQRIAVTTANRSSTSVLSS